jgi:hypothetical protein
MDFITDLPPSIDNSIGIEYDLLLVIVDRYTKVARYIPCLKTTTVEELADLFIKYWVKDHRIPASIISDCRSVFTSKFWSVLYFYLKIQKNLSTVFYP